MTTKELLEILDRTKSMDRYREAKNPPPKPITAKPIINWKVRKALKNSIFKKYLIIIACLLGIIVLFVITPLWAVYPPYGKAVLLTIPPILFICITWMLGCWWAYDKDRQLFFAINMGGIGIRLSFGLMWTIFVFKIPDIDHEMFVFALMAMWVLFTIPEIGMVNEFSNKLEATAELEPTD
jgi:hypothetical protein